MPGLVPGMFFFATALIDTKLARRDIRRAKRLIKSQPIWHCEYAGSRRRIATPWSLSSPNG
jgi:hypothetical protein